MFLGALQRCVIPRGTSGGFPSVGSRDLTGSCLPNQLIGAQNIKEMTWELTGGQLDHRTPRGTQSLRSRSAITWFCGTRDQFPLLTLSALQLN